MSRKEIQAPSHCVFHVQKQLTSREQKEVGGWHIDGTLSIVSLASVAILPNSAQGMPWTKSGNKLASKMRVVIQPTNVVHCGLRVQTHRTRVQKTALCSSCPLNC